MGKWDVQAPSFLGRMCRRVREISVVRPRVFYHQFPGFRIFSLFFTTLHEHSTDYTVDTASFSSGPIAFAMLYFSAPDEWSIRARGDLTGSAELYNSNVRDPYSRRLVPFLIVFVLHTDSTYIRPHSSLETLVQSTIVASPLVSDVIYFFNCSLSF